MRSFFLLLCFVSGTLVAQTFVRGKVMDKNGPVGFAPVLIKESNKGAVSDSAGNYSIQLPADSGTVTLLCSSVGYKKYERPIILTGKDLTVDIVLELEGKELTQVVISAGAFEASDEKKGVTMKARDIVTTAGNNGDIYSVMQTLPGVQQQGDQEGLFVRGGSASETKTIIDEMVVQSPFFSSVPDVPQKGRFSPFLFKGTVFSTGGYSAVYGQALSSVLNLKTTDLPDNSSTGIGIMPFGGSLSHTHRWENTSLSLEGNYTDMAFFFKVNKQLTHWVTPPKSLTGSMIFKQKTKNNGMFKLYTSYGNTSVALLLPDVNRLPEEYSFSNTNNNIYVNTSLRQPLGEKWQLFAAGSWSSDENKLAIEQTNASNSKAMTEGKVIVTNFLSNAINWKFGAEAIGANYVSHFDTLTNRYNPMFYAGFLESDISITKRLAARAGLRYEEDLGINKNNLAPRASVALKLSETSQLSVAYGDFYQTPQTNYLYVKNSLDFEKSSHYILNYQWVKEKRMFRVEVYDKEYSNLVRLDSVMNNTGYGYARGLDIFWRDNRTTFKNVDYWISYSYIDTKRLYLNFPIAATPNFVSTHNLSVVYKHWVPKIRTSFAFTFSYSSGRPYYDPNKPSDQFNTDHTPDYYNLNISVSKLTSIKGNFTVIYASVNNVLNRQNVFNYTYSTDGRSRIVSRSPSLISFFIGAFISLEKKKQG
jgi:hypothetical protein